MKFILVLLTFFIFKYSHAVDTYNSANGQLSIPTVFVGNTKYSNVVLSIDKVISVGQIATSSNDDYYNASTGQLTIPRAMVGNTLYTNVVVTFKKILSVEGATNLTNNTPALDQIQSLKYSLGPEMYTPLQQFEIIRNSPNQMVIFNLPQNTNISDFYQDETDSLRNKLLICYMAPSAFNLDNWFDKQYATNGLPSWVGNAEPPWINYYGVKYWDTEWIKTRHSLIDILVNGGCQGFFLDGIEIDSWVNGNPYGNQPNANAVQDAYNLLLDLCNYIQSKSNKNLKYPIILNAATKLLDSFPNTKNLINAILSESPYYDVSPNNYEITARNNNTVLGNIAYNIKNNQSVKIFEVDYIITATPQITPDQYLDIFEDMANTGVINSIQSSNTSFTNFQLGPNILTATKTNPNVIGQQNKVNMISGGLSINTKITCGDFGDIVIGSSGTNNINCGKGNDMIYAHPKNSISKDAIQITYQSMNSNSTQPYLTVNINGTDVLTQFPVLTSTDGKQTNTILINTAKFGNINSLNFKGTGMTYSNSTQFSNIRINQIIHNGNLIFLANSGSAFDNGIWSSTYSGLMNNYNTGTFLANSFPITSGFPLNTSDVIDGGGGTNTVVYRANKSNYTVSKQSDGSYLVTSATTAEGPDTLTNIQILQFADTTMTLN